MEFGQQMPMDNCKFLSRGRAGDGCPSVLEKYNLWLHSPNGEEELMMTK